MNLRTAVPILLAALSMTACGQSDDEHRVVGELASDRVEITAESSEPIVEILVAEGETVTADQLLARQSSERALSAVAEAEAAMEEAKARLDERVRGPRNEQIKAARANTGGAEKEVQFRRAEHERIRMLQEQNLASPDLLDRAKAALDGAEASLSLRRAQLEELLAGTTLEELAQVEQAVKRTEARLDSARVNLARHELRSPVDGVIDSRLFETGERPQPGQPVFVILPGTQPHARVYVPENIRVRIGPGSTALIHVDGLEAPVQGRVRWVASEAAFTPYYALTEKDRGRLSYVAKIDLTENRARLPDGVPVEVEFLIEAPSQ